MHSLLTGTGLAELSSNIYNDSNNEEVNQMANQQHLDLLTQNVETWYQWRNEYPDVQPDLSGGRLSYAKLSKSDFFGADLSGISLSEVNLSKGTRPKTKGKLKYVRLSLCGHLSLKWLNLLAE